MNNSATPLAPQEIATRLDEAATQARAISQFGDALTLDEAYEVQARLIALRVARGERRIGIKMGFTSRAKMAQMGVSDMIFGRLTDGMLIEPGSSISRARFVHPRVEPEIAFLLARPLAGRVDALSALAAVEGVAAALEVIDSRYENFKFSLTDVVADNSSSSGVVVGPWMPPQVSVFNRGMVLEIDGVARQIGSSAAILGNPVASLVAAARLVAERGDRLQAGDIVLAGGATAAEPLQAGQVVRLSVEALGSVGFSIGP